MSITVPVIILAGQSNAEITVMDDALVASLSARGNAFEFAKVAVSGTTIYRIPGVDWNAQSSGELLDHLVAATIETIAKVIDVGNIPEVRLVWSQGENDAASSQERYAEALGGLITAFRERIGVPDAEVIISMMPDANGVRDAQVQVAEQIDNVTLIETQDLERGDGVHYTAQAAATIVDRVLAATDITVPTLAGYQAMWSWSSVYLEGELVTVRGAPYYDFTFFGDNLDIPSDSRFSVTSGWGADRIVTGDLDDVVVSGFGWDVITTRGGNDKVHSGGGRDAVIAGDGDDIIHAGDDPDTVWGGAGNDLIDLGYWGDTGYGDAGDDILIGGWGRDTLSGGPGADTFVYQDAKDSFDPGFRSAFYGVDTITDFDGSADRIDLRALGDLFFIGSRSFRGDDGFRGNGWFHGKGWLLGKARSRGGFSSRDEHDGELRFEHDGDMTMIYADLDSDGQADFQIELAGTIALTSAMFIL